MHVVERGSGTPVVLLHGFPVDHRILLPLDPVVAAAGAFRRLHVDLPGMGRSPAGGVSSARDLVAAVERELDDRLGDEPFVLVGNSFGGMLARQVAHDRAERVLGLATIAGVVVADHADRDVPARTVLVEDPAAVGLAGDGAADYADLAVVQSPATARAFVEHVLPGLRAADPAAVQRISADYALDAEPEASSPPFGAPTLFITGRQDHVVGYRDAWVTLEHYPRATFAVLDGAGHNVHLERPATVAALVTDWLRSVARSG